MLQILTQPRGCLAKELLRVASTCKRLFEVVKKPQAWQELFVARQDQKYLSSCNILAHSARTGLIKLSTLAGDLSELPYLPKLRELDSKVT